MQFFLKLPKQLSKKTEFLLQPVPTHHALNTLTFRVNQGATLFLCWTNKIAIYEQAQRMGMVIEPCLKKGRADACCVQERHNNILLKGKKF